MKSFKILLVGDSGVGKTSFVNALCVKKFEPRYISTVGVSVQPVTLKIMNGENINLNIWDCAGQENLCGFKEAYYIDADACIIMTDKVYGEKSVTYWSKKVNCCVNNIPIMVCRNKSDIDSTPTLSTIYSIVAFDISVKNNKNFDKPLNYLVNTLMNKHDLIVSKTIKRTGIDKNEDENENEDDDDEDED